MTEAQLRALLKLPYLEDGFDVDDLRAIMGLFLFAEPDPGGGVPSASILNNAMTGKSGKSGGGQIN